MTSADGPAPATTLTRAYRAIEQLQRRIEDYEQGRDEPIAIVGIGCRFPGGATDPDRLWDLLAAGTDAISEIPADRWDVEEFYHPDAQRPGRMRTRWGGFLDHVDRFDHEFFGIARREAAAMDPQQRLALEVAWEALENAGLAPSGLAGSSTGVFLGVCSTDFATENFLELTDVTAYASTGTAHSLVPGRISYVLDLHGPSVAVDTACSSSLVAVRSACQSLRSGESDLALAGGVNVVLSPLPSVAFSQFPGMVSPDGRCKTFDAAANGYVRGEGCGVVVLKRLRDARRDGDPIVALIRGGAVNQDGRSSGVTAPNGAAQRDVLRRALASAGVDAGQVGFIEAHGTGTTLGDPIEVEALAEVYGRPDGAPVYLGSAKTNLGHLEAAAGIAGLITAALALQRAAVPPNVHFRSLNPHLSFAGTTFAVPTALQDWPTSGHPRFAAVSSFGFSGTNAHLLLEQAPELSPVDPDPSRPLSVLTLSARSPDALSALATRYADRLRTARVDLADACWSANTGRSALRHRLAVVGGTTDEVAERLEDYVDGLPGDTPVVGTAAPATTEAGVVFLFAGQGPQRVGMAEQLYRTQPTFRRVLDECETILRDRAGMPLLSVIHAADPGSDTVHQTLHSQPALFAVQYAMAALWRSWGVEPAAVLGHSFGEYVAAAAAGAMSLEDGLVLSVERGKLMQRLAESGAMAAVFASEQEVAAAVAPYPDAVSVAAVNGPGSVSISGRRAAVEAVCADFTARGVKVRPLRITTASHSPLVEEILPGLRAAADAVTFRPPLVPLVSNVSGTLWPWDRAPDADYWCAHARQPVRFADGVAALRTLGHRTFVEMGPAPTLLGLVSELMPPGDALLLPSLRPRSDDWPVLLDTVSRLYVSGVELDWRGFDADYRRARVPLPTYPFAPTPCGQPSARRADDLRRGRAQTAPVAGEPTPEDADLLYTVEWRAADPGSAADPASAADPGSAADGGSAAEPPSSWVVVDGDAADVAAHLAERARCVPTLDDVPDPTAPVSVVHLGGSLADAVTRAQTIAATRRPGPVRLWLVTRGATGPDASDPAQATLWGLGRSLQQEQPAVWGGLIDLDPRDDPAAQAGHIAAAIAAPDGEDQVAYRGGRRLVARLVRTEPPEQAGDGLRADATYLITGGFGGVGLQVARFLVRSGARRLVLLGRTALPPRREWSSRAGDDPIGRRLAAVRELEALGAEVHFPALDVADEAALQTFLADFDAEGRPPIRGVVHAAGTGDLVALEDLTPEVLERTLRPKLDGATALDRAFTGRALDFFVLFSSASAVLSSPFVGAYAAANAALAAVAAGRRARGVPGLAIDWGIWDDTGLARRGAEVSPGRSRGMDALAPEQALRLFGRLLTHGGAHVLTVRVDWPEWGSRYQRTSRSSLLAELLDAPRERAAAVGVVPDRAEIAALPAEKQREVLLARLSERVAAVLHAGSAGAVGADDSLVDLGLDSLMAVELKNEIEQRLDVTLSIAVFLEGATLSALTDQILARAAAPEPAPIQRVDRVPMTAEEVTAGLLAELDGLTDEQARAVLSGEDR